MAKRPDLTSHQRGIVKRYYDHRETIKTTKLAELVSELYLCTDDGKAEKLWRSAATALGGLGANEVRVKRILAERDLGALAKLVGELG